MHEKKAGRQQDELILYCGGNPSICRLPASLQWPQASLFPSVHPFIVYVYVNMSCHLLSLLSFAIFHAHYQCALKKAR
jgi:hypothetical protein